MALRKFEVTVTGTFTRTGVVEVDVADDPNESPETYTEVLTVFEQSNAPTEYDSEESSIEEVEP